MDDEYIRSIRITDISGDNTYLSRLPVVKNLAALDSLDLDGRVTFFGNIHMNAVLIGVGKMSHSKHTKRSYSIYIEKWNKSAKKYINVCAICGHKGYSPVIEYDDFCNTRENNAIYKELSKTLCKLELDESGRCVDCARIQDKVKINKLPKENEYDKD